MNARRSLETMIRRTTSRPFRYKFSIFYVAIVGGVAFLNSLRSCSREMVVASSVGIGLATLALLGLEWLEQVRFGSQSPRYVPPSRRARLALLLARLALIEGAVALDCNMAFAGIALFLYPMGPYSAYYAFGGWSSILISLFYIALVFWRAGQTSPQWHLNPEASPYVLAFTFVMLFVPLIAHIIRRDDETRRRTEMLLSDLEVAHIKLQAYTEQVAELAAADERNRLARDIHDSVGHYLAAVNIQLEKALLYQERDPAAATQAIRDAKQAAADALRDVRSSVRALRDATERFSLAASLEKLIREIDGNSFKITLTVNGDESAYPRSTLTALYRAAQEGLTNVQKHAHARQVDLTIDLGEREARLVLQDDGQGFDPAILHRPISLPQLGLGLRGIQERLDLVRGQLMLQSKPRKGTVLSVVVPKAAANLTDRQPGEVLMGEEKP
ncbi:MAG: sensor histidine kinase [Anaerolineales bacterium]|nr:sensor histidine kinase [Anaerolineales bacterium]